MSTANQTEKKDRDLATETTAFLSGKLAQVDLARIEKELKALWRSASESSEEGGSVTRACAMNLILYSQDEDAETAAGNILDDITTRHPLRAILAISRPAAKQRLEAWVSARCHLTDSKSGKQICCEQITVLSEGNGPDELASVVLPLVIADLPVHLWWRVKGLSRPDLDPFLSSIDELIVDSAQDVDEGTILCDLSLLISSVRKKRDVVVSDLNWRRSYVWREAFALAFNQDEGPFTPAAISSIRQLNIRYANAKVSQGSSTAAIFNQSLLYLGWLSSRLGWQAKQARSVNKESISITFAGKDKQIDVQLSQYSCQSAYPGALCSVEVCLADPAGSSVYISHPKGTPSVQVKYSGRADDRSANSSEHGQSQNFTLSEINESQVIDDELENANRDPAFEPALDAALQILKVLSPETGTK